MMCLTTSTTLLFVCSSIIICSCAPQQHRQQNQQSQQWWGESSLEQLSRKSKLFPFTNYSISNDGMHSRIKFSDPPFVTRSQHRMQCIDGTAECLHGKKLLTGQNGFGSRVGDLVSNADSRESHRPTASVSKAQLQLQGLKAEKLENLYPTKAMFKQEDLKFPSGDDVDPKPLPQLSPLPNKITQQKPLNTSYFDGTNNTEGRIIAYKLNQTSVVPLQAAGSTVPRPTITIGQLARQVLFPAWFWTRYASNRRLDAGEGGNNTRTPYLKSSSTTATQAPAALPSITFDNNISRFMKLFTLVRFPNTPCVSSSGRNGTCYHSRECTTMGGTGTNSCASGFGVCCVVENTCGQTTSTNGTYFVDNDMIFKSNNLNTCSLQVQKISPAVKQMRLDFHFFSLLPPNAGNCELDRFIISGQNTNDIVPILCGENNGTHLYVETEGSSTGIQLVVLTTGIGKRRWSIQITQLEAASHISAPTNCLQYHTGVMGSIASFNYISAASPQYLNNLNYAICIRKEPGFCSVTFTNSAPDGTYMPFQVVNANGNGQLVIPGDQAGIRVRDCPYDFLVINGYRLQ